MPSLSSTYLLPAILLNPAFILHLINTFVSHIIPPVPDIPSVSPHPTFETLGPVPGATPYMDMHADDQLCWRYTAIMVFVQLLAFGRIQDNRVQIKAKRAAKVEKEKAFKEKIAMLEDERRQQMAIRQVDGKCDLLLDEFYVNGCVSPCTHGRAANGTAKVNGIAKENGNARVEEPESEESLVSETSEEEMFI